MNIADRVLMLCVIPVIIQAGIMVGVTFVGFGIAAVQYLAR